MFVSRLRKEQRDVDIEPLFQALANCREPFRRPGNLDHHVRAIHALPQTVRLGDRGFRVVTKKRRNLNAHVAVAALGLLIDRPEDVAGVLNVAKSNFLENAIGIELLRFRRVQNVSVKIASGDGLLKNGRVGGHPAQAIVIDIFLQLPARKQVAAHIIHPGRLAVRQQALKRIRAFSLGDIRQSSCRRHRLFSLASKNALKSILPLSQGPYSRPQNSYTFTFIPAPNFASSALIFPSRRTWRSSCVNFAPRNAFTKSSASFTPTTREPSTITLILSCSTP